MSESNYTPLTNDQKILENFMKILKFYNEIIKSSPLIVSDQEFLNYKKQKVKYSQEIKKLEEFIKPKSKIDFNIEIQEISSIDLNIDQCPELESHRVNNESRYILNIPENKKTRFNVYILKKINDLENDLEDFLEILDYFYLKYKKQYDNFSFYNIFASSSLTLIESMSLMFRPQVYTGVVSIFISTSIAISVAILKLKNYKEKVKTTEKVYSCQAQLFTFDKFLKTSLNMQSEIIPD